MAMSNINDLCLKNLSSLYKDSPDEQIITANCRFDSGGNRESQLLLHFELYRIGFKVGEVLRLWLLQVLSRN